MSGACIAIQGIYEDVLVKTSGYPTAHGTPNEAIPTRDEPATNGPPESPYIRNINIT